MITIEQFNKKYPVGAKVWADVYGGVQLCTVKSEAIERKGEVCPVPSFVADYGKVQNVIVRLSDVLCVVGCKNPAEVQTVKEVANGNG